MATVSIYLNFNRTTEEAFNFYKAVFGGEFIGEVARMGSVPQAEGMPAMAEDDKNLVMHVALPLMGGVVLMGTDAPESMGFTVVPGNNVYINLQPDSRVEVDRLYTALAEGGRPETAPQEMFWGDYYGSCTDRFGIQWMFNTTSKE